MSTLIPERSLKPLSSSFPGSTSNCAESVLSQLTKIYREDAVGLCPHCKTGVEEQHIRYYSPLWQDAQVWCEWCNRYIRMWDFK